MIPCLLAKSIDRLVLPYQTMVANNPKNVSARLQIAILYARYGLYEDAEIAFEGVMPPPEEAARTEGPFGEWPGYYASAERPEPVFRIKACYHRDDPIVTAAPPAKPTAATDPR